ncbi:MAG: class I SAM-dependent methyltransferase [Parcubacteria group bacterium]|jgi:ubiquinone/menaquinone biosynthesis C-methylase UbiE
MENYKSNYTKSYQNNSKRGKGYDKKIENKFELFIWELEKYFLKRIVSGNFRNLGKVSYMDFACGTGRIIEYLNKEFNFKEIIGIDTSFAMLEEAKKKTNADFLCGNIVENKNLLDGKKFDLITSFRLFLNMEKENKGIILAELCKCLKDDGYLIINNHINRFSLLGIQFWIRKNLLKEKGKIINTATEKEFRKLLDESGFEIIKIEKFTVFPGRKKIILLPEKILFKSELFLSKIPLIRNLGLNQIYICRKK